MADLKEIKIFLASSIVEFDRERDELQTYITRLNKEYMPRGIYFNLEVCENVSNALALTRKQDEYEETKAGLDAVLAFNKQREIQ